VGTLLKRNGPTRFGAACSFILKACKRGDPVPYWSAISAVVPAMFAPGAGPITFAVSSAGISKPATWGSGLAFLNTKAAFAM
jgi:hypothetical protein